MGMKLDPTKMQDWQIAEAAEENMKTPQQLAEMLTSQLPDMLVIPFMGNWPENAQPVHFGPRARKVQHITLD